MADRACSFMALAWFQLPSVETDGLRGDLFLLALAKFLSGKLFLAIFSNWAKALERGRLYYPSVETDGN